MGLVSLKKGPQRALSPFAHVKTRREDKLCEPRRELSPDAGPTGALILDFPAYRTVRNTYWWFIPPSLWYFIIVVQMDYSILFLMLFVIVI